MKTSDFYYDLPKELIAQDPLPDRSSSRLMHLSLSDGSIEHRHFTDVLSYLRAGDCLVINDTKVIPARLYGSREKTGGAVEILLLKRNADDVWECLVKPGKKARTGDRIIFGDGILKGEITAVRSAYKLPGFLAPERPGDDPADTVLALKLSAGDLAELIKTLQRNDFFIRGDLEYAVA